MNALHDQQQIIKQTQNNYGITRIDTDKTHGWQVRLERRGKTLPSKFFADLKHKGRDAAFTNAVHYRDKLIFKHQGFSRLEISKLSSDGKNPGVTKVSRVVWSSNPQRPRTETYWIAIWRPKPNLRKSKSFSVNKYGKKEAFRLAIEARKQGEQTMLDEIYLSLLKSSDTKRKKFLGLKNGNQSNDERMVAKR